MTAAVALLDMSAECCGAALREGAQDAALPEREPVAVTVEEGVTVFPQDIGHFEPWPRHERVSPGSGPSKSRGLVVLSSFGGATWV